MDFTQACQVLQLTKGDLMNYTFGKNYRGIDSAIPQDYVNAHNMHIELFFFATDCRESLYKIVDMREAISPHIKSAIILKAFYQDLYLSMLRKKTNDIAMIYIKNRFSAIEDILDSFVFEYKD